MDSMDLRALRDRFGLFGAFTAVWIIIFVVVVMLLGEIEKNESEYIKHINNEMLDEAVIHFDNMIITRNWNASHGGVYVKEHDGIKPNKYLKDNVMHSDENETYIKINPAWMTRQISELANKTSKSYYKITSLRPINPINKADEFEKEALEYFEKNRDEPYYMRFIKLDDGIKKLNFMGSLKVTKNCLKCHAEQGYKIGDIRGGIRVVLPLNNYNSRMKIIKERSFHNRVIVMIFGLIVGFLMSIYLRVIFYHQKDIERLNEELEDKVLQRTQELQEINATLEQRVADEVEKNRKKDEMMLAQSRYLAMGEIIEMISHQWRQPISVIGAITSHMSINIELELDTRENMKAELDKLSYQIHELSKIISDFSDLFEADSQKVLLKPSAIIEEILNVMHSSLKHHEIEVETSYENKSELMLMSRDLFQVYWNVINNAKEILVERNIENPKIKIEIHESEKEVVTNISDNGGGIDEEYFDKIFEPYFSTKENLNGKGLGLYVAKTLLEKKMNGSIVAKNNDSGAIFTIVIQKQATQNS